jgi:ribulose-phosphate 3-epimerase
MSIICPTILAQDSHDFRDQVDRIVGFATRVQVDLTDGIFTPHKNISLSQIWLPENIETDIHLMYKDPESHIDFIKKLQPSMVIVHAESLADIPLFASKMRENNIKTGIALLPETQVKDIAYLFPHVQHVLLFAGTLGAFGGKADLEVLKKVSEIRQYDKRVEIGWDGGASEDNCRQLSEAGIQVINVGSAIQKAKDPEGAYATMKALVTSTIHA